ncbi:MAG: peptidoglycan/xylan/chitin deacetylase (PgdA/CDA1 family) [Arcticibacterium sp.]|jgi:peptidoglycan/xylan/chitin deacetylase (PgdA/CDA1 family)
MYSTDPGKDMDPMINKIKRRSQWLIKDLFYSFKSTNYWRSKKGSCVICYHGIDHVGSLGFNTRFISQKNLETQIVFFKKYFHIATIKDYVLGNYPKNVFTIVLTFDDGYRNNLELVVPLLEKHQVPATFFITSIQASGHNILWSDHLDLGFGYTQSNIQINGREFQKKKDGFYELSSDLSLKNACRQEGFHFKEEMMRMVSGEFKNNPKLDIYWQLIDAKQITSLKNSQWVTIGSHGHFHNNLGLIGLEDAKTDLLNSKKYLENLLEDEVKILAFPDGSYNKETLDLAQKIGYEYQFAIEYLHEGDYKDKRLFNRIGNNPFIKLEHQAKCLIDGHY